MRSLSMRSCIRMFFGALVLCAAIFFAMPAQAATTDIKAISMNKTYSLDLNGGSNESVKMALTTGDDNGKYKFIVNGKTVYSKSYTNSAVLSGTAYYFDVNTKDNYKEFMVEITGYSGCLTDLFVVRYLTATNVKVYRLDDSNWKGEVYRIGNLVKNTGSNKFYIDVDTPFNCGTFGCFYAKIAFKLNGAKLVPITASTYVIDSELMQSIMKSASGSSYYRVKTTLKVYTTYSASSSYTTISGGTNFTVDKFALGPKYGEYSYGLYVHIKTADGKTGWVYLTGNPAKQYLQFCPGWG